MIIKDICQGTAFSIIFPSTCKYSCLWLHGFTENSNTIISKSILKNIAEKYCCAIILPDVKDNFYLNQTEHYLINEFIPFLQNKYNLLTDSSASFIAGISMGGFGSLLLGSAHTTLFNKIVSISGTFIIEGASNGSTDIVCNLPPSYFLKLFEAEHLGYLEPLRTSYVHNPLVRALDALKHSKLPPVFLACGISDELLYQPNRKIYDSLLHSGGNVTWFEDEGKHNWTFYNQAIPHAFEWLIKKPCQ